MPASRRRGRRLASGAHVAICTLSDGTVAHMPCNPAVGGTAKGHLVREIDALGGLMGRAIDATGIQFKLLNRSRGPAVWSPRAQADKRRYGAVGARPRSRRCRTSTGSSGKAGRILADGSGVSRVWSSRTARRLRCRSLVRHDRHVPERPGPRRPEQRPAGRAGEPPSQRSRRVAARRSVSRGAG